MPQCINAVTIHNLQRAAKMTESKANDRVSNLLKIQWYNASDCFMHVALCGNSIAVQINKAERISMWFYMSANVSQRQLWTDSLRSQSQRPRDCLEYLGQLGRVVRQQTFSPSDQWLQQTCQLDPCMPGGLQGIYTSLLNLCLWYVATADLSKIPTP